MSGSEHRNRWRVGATALTILVAVALPALAYAHLERPSYWPDPAPDRSVSPPAGGEVPDARSLESAVTGKGPGEVRVVCLGAKGSKSLKVLRDSLRKAKKKGVNLRPEPAAAQVVGRQGAQEPRPQRGAREAVRVPRDPGGGQRLRQQRPGRDHARPLPRAGLPQGAPQRPEVRRPDPAGLERRPHAQLPLPGHLPQRPEPRLRPGAQGAEGAGAEPAARRPPRDSRRGRVRALQLPDRGLGPEPRRRADRRRQRL